MDTVLDRLVVGNSRIGYAIRRRLGRWPADPAPGSLTGTTALVTGAGSGLGLATATGLANLGARVHLLGRSAERLRFARAEVLGRVPGADVHIEQCDLAVMARVREFADDFADRVPRLGVLVHNAGAMTATRTETEEGNEVGFATHVLGPFLLTTLLRTALAAAAPARVIFVSSSGMYGQALRVDDPQFREGDYRSVTAYARTKRMQVSLAREFAQRLQPVGIAVHAMHPGWVDTPGLATSLPRFHTLLAPLLRTPAEGADTTVWLAAAADPQSHSGQFWHDRRIRPTRLLRPTGDTAENRAQLWRICEQLTWLE